MHVHNRRYRNLAAICASVLWMLRVRAPARLLIAYTICYCLYIAQKVG